MFLVSIHGAFRFTFAHVLHISGCLQPRTSSAGESGDAGCMTTEKAKAVQQIEREQCMLVVCHAVCTVHTEYMMLRRC